jgi:hypothetical protein
LRTIFSENRRTLFRIMRSIAHPRLMFCNLFGDRRPYSMRIQSDGGCDARAGSIGRWDNNVARRIGGIGAKI